MPSRGTWPVVGHCTVAPTSRPQSSRSRPQSCRRRPRANGATAARSPAAYQPGECGRLLAQRAAHRPLCQRLLPPLPQLHSAKHLLRGRNMPQDTAGQGCYTAAGRLASTVLRVTSSEGQVHLLLTATATVNRRPRHDDSQPL